MSDPVTPKSQPETVLVAASRSVTDIVLTGSIITYRHKHGTDLIAATGENVRTLAERMFNSSARLKAVLAKLEGPVPADAARPAVRGHLWLWTALAEVLKPTENLRGLRRVFFGKPDAPDALEVPQAWAEELLTWLVVNDTHPDGARNRGPQKVVEGTARVSQASEDVLDLSRRAFAGLSFLEPARQRLGSVVFFSSDALETCGEYRELMRDKWKPDAIEDPKRALNILSRYIRFLNDLNGGFDLEHVTTNVSGYEFYVY